MVKCNCNFCNSKLIETYITKTIQVGTCESCNLKQQFSFDHIDTTFYTTNQNLPENFVSERLRQVPWNKQRINILKKYFSNLHDKSVIDYGCGTGGFIEYSKDKFKSIIGFDLSTEACKINSYYGIKSVSNIEDLDNTYDIVTLFHVLEHIKNPISFIENIKKQLSNVKYFIIEVPNTDEALVSIYNNKSYMDNHYCLDHLWYFTENTLKFILEKCNLEVVHSDQIQRYSLMNHLKWLCNKDEISFSVFNQINNQYTKHLINNKIADSLFMICKVNLEN